RGTRLEDGTGNLLEAVASGRAPSKRDCYVLDVVDNNKRCSLVTFPSLVGLNPEFELHGESAVKAIEEIEDLQDKYAGIDLSAITDLKDVKVYIESLDMFAEPYTEEVREFSEFRWMQTQDGAYVLDIPESAEVQVQAKAANEYWR